MLLFDYPLCSFVFILAHDQNCTPLNHSPYSPSTWAWVMGYRCWSLCVSLSTWPRCTSLTKYPGGALGMWPPWCVMARVDSRNSDGDPPGIFRSCVSTVVGNLHLNSHNFFQKEFRNLLFSNNQSISSCGTLSNA